MAKIEDGPVTTYLVPGTFSSAFPTEQDLRDSLSANLGAFANDIGSGQWRNAIATSKYLIAPIAYRRGIAPGNLENVEALLSMPGGADVSEFVSVFNKAITSGSTPDELASNLASSLQTLSSIGQVPVLGWVVQIGAMLVNLGVMAAQAIKGAGSGGGSQRYPAFQYSYDADERWTRILLEAAESEDLTHIFLPPAPNFGIKTGSWGVESQCLNLLGKTQKYKLWADRKPDCENTEVTGSIFSPEPDPDVLGLVPFLLEGTQGWQFRKYAPRSTRPSAPFGGLQSWVKFKPSFLQGSALLWNMIRKNGVDAFRIRPKIMTTRWRDFYDELFQWGARFKDPQKRRMIWHAARWLDTLVDEQEHGGAELFPVYGDKKAKTGFYQGNVPGWVANYPFTTGQLIKYIIEQQVTKKYKQYLRTLTCAYVPYDAPAFIEDRAGNGDLSRYMMEMRTKLISHPALANVDVEMIPRGTRQDAEFYTAAKAMQKSIRDVKLDPTAPSPKMPSGPATGPRVPVGGVGKPSPDGLFGPDDKPSKPSRDPAEGSPVMPDGPDISGESGPGGAGVIIAAAAAIGLFAALRK